MLKSICSSTIATIISLFPLTANATVIDPTELAVFKAVNDSSSVYCEEKDSGTTETNALTEARNEFINVLSEELDVSTAYINSSFGEAEWAGYWQLFNYFAMSECPEYY